MKRKRNQRTSLAPKPASLLSRTYDKAAKDFLAMRQILAPILKETVTEFRQLSLEAIERDCIENDPWVSSIPVDPGRTNRRFRRRLSRKIRSLGTEQSERDEGYITFDLLFYARVPSTGERIKFLINIEAPRSDPDYPLYKRAYFYANRLTSSQKERDFVGQDYDSICKVYTIWLCFYLPEGEKSSVTHYEMREVNDVGNHHEAKSTYDLINITLVYVGNDEIQSKLLRFLRLIFLSRLSDEALAQKLEDDFGIEADDDTKKEMKAMCNLSEGLKEEGRVEGRAEGEGNIILNMLKERMRLDAIERFSGWTADRIRALAEKNGLAVE